MISLTSNGSPGETTAAYALLAIISDPALAKKRLDEIAAEKQASLETMENARAMMAEAQKYREEALRDASAAAAQAQAHHEGVAAKLAEVKKVSDDFALHSKTRSKQLDDHEAVLSTKQKQIEDHDAAVTKRESSLAAREAAVSEREKSVINREAKAAQLSLDAQALKDECEERMAKLRAITAPVEKK